MHIVDPILHPVLALLLLTAVVALAMMTSRIPIFRKNFDRADTMATRPELSPYLTGIARRLSDNFNNLLEVPVLFYVLCLVIADSNMTDDTHLWLAWAFVACRVLHSLIHCGYNNMLHRGAIYGLATTFLLVMLGRVIAAALS